MRYDISRKKGIGHIMPSKVISVQKSREVSALLAVPNACIIAGGTTFPQPPDDDLYLVDISGLEGMDGIKQKGTRIEIGPLTTLNAMENSMVLKAYAPALADAAASAALPEIRERATFGGNIAWSRIGDTAAALLASGAKLTIRTDSDYRELPIDRFWPVSGGNDLEYDEWITSVSIPVPKEPFWGDAFKKTGDWDLTREPAAAAAVRLSLDADDRITAVRGGIRTAAGHIRRMFPLEKALKNRPATPENISGAIRMMIPAVQDHIDEKKLTDLLSDILEHAVKMARERRTL